MRGGVDSMDVFYRYSLEDREVMHKIITETTNKTGLPLI
jgi:hypothetical protein